MSEDHDGRAIREMGNIISKPIQLLVSQYSQAAGLEVHHIHQSNEMHALVIETSPAVAASSLAIAFQIQLAIIREDIVFTRHIKHLARFGDMKNLCHGVK